MKGEFELIDGIRRMFPSPAGITGIGDDCSVIPQANGNDTLVSTDMLVDGTHFLLEDISPYQLGWKSAASNFSDIAAMGGAPVGSFLAVALPKDLPDGWVDNFLEGYRDVSVRYGFPLLGGDTTASLDRMCICVTVLGRIASGRALTRKGARPGDSVCVTGTLGDSAAGLDAVLNAVPRTSYVQHLVNRHYLPSPRLEEGAVLAGCEGVHSMMDISDGIGSDLRHIMEESGVGAEIELSKLPLSEELGLYCHVRGLDIYELAASGGEDYELLFTADPDCEASLPVAHTVIGRITASPGLVWRGSDRDYCGYRHF